MSKTTQKIKLTPKQVRVIKDCWKAFRNIEDKFYLFVGEIERAMQKHTGIEDIEFIVDSFCTGHFIGVGNMSRTVRLYQKEELEKRRRPSSRSVR